MYSAMFFLIVTYGGPLERTQPLNINNIPTMSECINLKNQIKQKEKNVKSINCYKVNKGK